MCLELFRKFRSAAVVAPPVSCRKVGQKANANVSADVYPRTGHGKAAARLRQSHMRAEATSAATDVRTAKNLKSGNFDFRHVTFCAKVHPHTTADVSADVYPRAGPQKAAAGPRQPHIRAESSSAQVSWRLTYCRIRQAPKVTTSERTNAQWVKPALRSRSRGMKS